MSLPYADTGAGVQGALRALVAAVLLVVAGVAASAVVTALAVVPVVVWGVASTSPLAFALTIVGAGLGFVVTVAAYLAYRSVGVDYVGYRVPTLPDLGWIVGSYVVVLGSVMVIGFVLQVLGASPDTANQTAERGMQNPELFLWFIPLSFLVIGPAEELLFRGVVQGRLRESFGPWVAVPVAAALFALIHFFALTGGAGDRFVAVGILFVPSLVFGVAYERTRNIVVPILVHGAYNATIGAILYVAMRFAGGPPGLL
jgi:membrane protease YdiL (CAAX protease family)